MTTIPVSSLKITAGVLEYDDLNPLTNESIKMKLIPTRNGKTLLDELYDSKNIKTQCLDELVDFKYNIINKTADQLQYIIDKINELDKEQITIQTILETLDSRSLNSYTEIAYSEFTQPNESNFGFNCVYENGSDVDYNVPPRRFMIYGSSWIYNLDSLSEILKSALYKEYDMRKFIIVNNNEYDILHLHTILSQTNKHTEPVKPVKPIEPVKSTIKPTVKPIEAVKPSDCIIDLYTNDEEYKDIYPKIKSVFDFIKSGPLTADFIKQSILDDSNKKIMETFADAYNDFIKQTVDQYTTCLPLSKNDVMTVHSNVILSSGFKSDRIAMIGSMIKYIKHRYVYSYHPIANKQSLGDQRDAKLKGNETSTEKVNRIKIMYNIFEKTPIELLIHGVSTRIRILISQKCNPKILFEKMITESHPVFNNADNYSYFKMRPFDLIIYRYAYEAVNNESFDIKVLSTSGVVEEICKNCRPLPNKSKIILLYNEFTKNKFKAQHLVDSDSIVIKTADGKIYEIIEIENVEQIHNTVMEIFRNNHAIVSVTYPKSIKITDIDDEQSYFIIVVEILCGIFHIPIPTPI